jgi:hypothetical protein
MSAIAPIKAEGAGRGSAPQVGLLVALVMLLVAGNLAGSGVVDLARAGVALPGSEQGNLLRVLALWVARWPAGVLDPATALVIVYIVVTAIVSGLLYEALCRSNWPPLMAAALLGLVVAHGLVLFAVTSTVPEFLLVLALGAIIPSRRQLEAVGDVRSIINYGLTLPLLLLAGPPLAVLLPPLVFAVPLRDSQARRQFKMFVALLLVAVVPALIVLAGAAAIALRGGVGLEFLVTPFVSAFQLHAGESAGTSLAMSVTALVGLVVVLHIFIRDRRRQVRSSVLALLLPAYLVAGNSIFSWHLSAWTPALALLATTLGWLADTRIRPWMRWLTLGLMATSTGASWLIASQWATPQWIASLLRFHLFA